MNLTIKNVSGEALRILKDWAVDEEIDLDYWRIRQFADSKDILDAITLGDLQIFHASTALNSETAYQVLVQDYPFSVAVDKNGTNQSLSGNDWIEINADRIIWDLGSNYDAETDDFVIPFDGLFFMDGEWLIKNAANVTAIELVLFQRGDPDDYWFILDKKLLSSGQTEAQLSAATMFDFKKGERYAVKIKLYGENASATIDGDDDFTAWGISFSKPLYFVNR